jgi:hypothetical protein
MKRFRSVTIMVSSVLALVGYVIPAGVAQGAGLSAAQKNFLGYQEPLCQSRASLCADAYDNPEGEYWDTTSRRSCSSPTAPDRATTSLTR